MIHQRKILKAIAYAILLCFTSLTGAQPLYAIPANTQLPTPGELGVIGTVDKPVYGLFIANKIDTNTAETFRHGIWYGKDDIVQRLTIVPLTLKQFQK